MFNQFKSLFVPASKSAKKNKLGLTRVAIKESEIRDHYRQQPSFANYFPVMEYDRQSQCFLLEDGYSVGVGFELKDVSCEARSLQFLMTLRDKFQRLFQDTIPQESNSPWILQFYLQDELSLQSYKETFKNYIKPEHQTTAYSQAYLKLFEEHCDYITRPEGLFVDQLVTGTLFRGKVRRVRLVIYRRLNSKIKAGRGRDAIQSINAVAKNVFNQFKNSGVRAERMTGKHYYEWMIRWFNPAPSYGDGSVDKLLQRHPFPGDDQLPFGYDFAEQTIFSVPESDEQKGVWYFDKLPHKFITVEGLSTIPTIGHLSAELEQGSHFAALFDEFPEGSVFCLTVVIEDQNTVREHIKEIEKSAVGDEADANLARLDCERAKYEVEQGNYLFPCVMGVYIRAHDMQTLYNHEIDVERTLINNGLKPIKGEVDLTPLDAYLRYLPFCYDYRFDSAYTSRSRYIYARQIANLIPLYGRYRGTQHPGILRFNRAGEPLSLDMLNREDKSFNSHALYFGGTGSGKSATLTSDLLQVMAIYRPRLIIIEKGNSFGLLGDYFASLGLTVNKVKLTRSNPVPLNPFADGLRLLEQLGHLANTAIQEKIEEEEVSLDATLNSLTQAATANEADIDEERDILGEMALAVQLMVTGAEAKEEVKITRQDRLSILNAIMLAANLALSEGANELLAEHIVKAFRQMADAQDATNSASGAVQATRLREMADGIDYFCKDDLSSRFFNTPGRPWPEVDVTILDVGIMSSQEYEAQLALATMGILNRVASLAEANQYKGRMTILVTDESHIVIKNKLVAAHYTKASKMARKLGWWLWFATQNMGDFPDEARKMLSMIEFWFIMGTTEEELTEIKRFKSFTEEQHRLLHSVRKVIGKYAEGVILSPKVMGLFRSIPLRFALALAQTEPEEKTARFNIKEQFGISELEAAKLIADAMMQAKGDD